MKWFDVNAKKHEVEMDTDYEGQMKDSDGVRKFMEVSVDGEDAGMAEEEGIKLFFTISTPHIDRDGDTIDQRGWDLSEYKKNPVVLWAHDSTALPVAKANATYLDTVQSKSSDEESVHLMSVAEFPSRELYPFGNMVGRLYKNGYLHGASVGFLPLEYEMSKDRDGFAPVDFKKQRLLEWSAVPVPSNPEGLVHARSAGIDLAPMVDWAEKILDGEGALILPKHLIEEVRKNATSKVFILDKSSGIQLDMFKMEDQSETVDIKPHREEPVETEEKTITKDVSVPSFIRSNARRGLGYYEDGLAGDGLVGRTVTEARRMAEGSVTEDKLKRMAAWFKRHKSDLDAPRNSNADHEDYPGAGAVAWLLWGGNPTSNPMRASDWADRKLAQLEEEKSFNDKEDKTVISYRSAHPGGSAKAPEDEAWDGPKYVAEADVEELYDMSTYYDGDGENKGDYKLPHHKPDGTVVLRGVQAAMAALMGARGGVDVPADERKGIYDHLAEHYRAFDKEPPEFDGYEDDGYQEEKAEAEEVVEEKELTPCADEAEAVETLQKDDDDLRRLAKATFERRVLSLTQELKSLVGEISRGVDR